MKAKVVKTGEIVDVYHESQHGQITNIYKESVLVNGRMWTEEELDLCMEANVAPEKIYLYPSDRAGEEYESEWGDKPWGKDYVEYTRTDSFIEKACEWLGPVFKDFAGYYSGVELLDNFKNYMKGE